MLIKSLDDVIPYVKKNKLEKRLNSSFNTCHINKPANTFYSIQKMKKFVELNKEVTFKNYYDFLSNEFPKYNKFTDYLKDKVAFWRRMDENQQKVKLDDKITDNDLLIYLLKKFVTDPVRGRLEEIRTLVILQKRFPDFTITEPTPFEDMRECFDFKLTNGQITFYFQHKPELFFKGLKTTTRRSFLKVKNAAERYKHPIFFTKEFYNNTIQIYIRNKQNKGVKFVKVNDFPIEMLTQEQINTLSFKTLNRIENLNASV